MILSTAPWFGRDNNSAPIYPLKYQITKSHCIVRINHSTVLGRWPCTWAGLTLILGIPLLYLPHSAWAAGSLAEWAVELGRMMEYINQSQPNLGARPPAQPWTELRKSLFYVLLSNSQACMARQKFLATMLRAVWAVSVTRNHAVRILPAVSQNCFGSP